MLWLESLLATHKLSKGTFWPALQRELAQDQKFRQDLERYANISQFAEGRKSAQIWKFCRDWKDRKMAEIGAEDLLDDVYGLYEDSATLAVRGFAATLTNSRDPLRQQVDELDACVREGSAHRKQMEAKIKNLEARYGAIVEELDKLPGAVEKKMSQLIDGQLIQPLQQWAATQERWRGVYKDTQGNVIETDRLEFPGGRMQIKKWLREIAEPKLGGAMRQKFGLVGTKALQQLRAAIHERWQSCISMVEQLKAAMPPGLSLIHI